MTIVVTKEMEDAGFAKVKDLAAQYGESWALSMVSTQDIMTAMAHVYVAMRAVEPAPAVDRDHARADDNGMAQKS